jgi:hypothetical protein
MGEKFDTAKEKLKNTLTDTPSKDKTINAFKGGISAYEGYTFLLPVFERVIVAKHNKNMDKAAILFNEAWARIAQRTKLQKDYKQQGQPQCFLFKASQCEKVLQRG